MANRATVSAGLLLYRRIGDALEVLLAHPGGPFWAHRDAGTWSIPKAWWPTVKSHLRRRVVSLRKRRVSAPRGPFLSLGSVRQKAGKLIYA